jgi:histone-binding protein RBBP4
MAATDTGVCARCNAAVSCFEQHERGARARAQGLREGRTRVQQCLSVCASGGAVWKLTSPCARRPPGKNYRENRAILGTHTSESDQNFLMIAKVTTPIEHEDLIENRKYDEYTQEAGGYGQNRSQVEIVQRINHEGEVNRARYLPQNPTVMATKGPSKDVLVFDYTKHSSQPASDGVCRPQVRLGGHTDEGYGLCWNPLQEGVVVSASNDGIICMWDIESKTENKRIPQPLATFAAHKGAAQDVTCSTFQAHTFASVGDDQFLMIWDDRTADKAAMAARAHEAEVNAVAFNPHKEELLLTGSADRTVAMWDIRNLSKMIYSFQHHQDAVMQVQWSPEHPDIFASAAQDRRVCVWDIRSVGVVCLV